VPLPVVPLTMAAIRGMGAQQRALAAPLLPSTATMPRSGTVTETPHSACTPP
jgi:hypothetical protein